MRIHTDALVLRSVDFGESDRILHLLVPDGGRLTAIAKGARRSVRRFPGALDLFQRIHAEIERRRGSPAMSRLEQARLVEPFGPLRCDPARFALGCYLLEMLDRLAPEGGARADTRRLFAFALAALRAIAAREPDAKLRAWVELHALDALGLRPSLRDCVRCGTPVSGARVDFSVSEGGVACPRCAGGLRGAIPVHLGTLRALEQGLRFDLDRLDRLKLPPRALEEAHRILSRFQRFHVGVELSSERFLDEMLGGRDGRASPPADTGGAVYTRRPSHPPLSKDTAEQP